MRRRPVRASAATAIYVPGFEGVEVIRLGSGSFEAEVGIRKYEY
jgi:hypothetical protein